MAKISYEGDGGSSEAILGGPGRHTKAYGIKCLLKELHC